MATDSLNIDQLLNAFLKSNPSGLSALLKEAKQMGLSPPTETKSPVVKKPKCRRPSPDFFLYVYCGCELCHSIHTSLYKMVFDEETGAFKSNKKPLDFPITEGALRKQITTSVTCVDCVTVLSANETADLVALLLSQTCADKSAMRTLELKKKLRQLL